MMKAERDVDKVYPIRDYVAKLRRLADALESGKPFHIQIARERIVVPAHAIYSVEHEREGGWEEIEFQVRWSEADAATAKTEAATDEDADAV